MGKLIVHLYYYPMDTLPVEILGEIASVDVEAYRAMCLVKLFADSLTADTITNWQIHFGYFVEITAEEITWSYLGKKHRIGYPALIESDGAEWWYQHGKLHREDGPAVILPSDTQQWYRNGELHRDGGPAVIYPDGTQRWYQNGKQHRDDGPAEIYYTGSKMWYRHGELHRDDGPAMMWSWGLHRWYRHGVEITQ